MAESKNSPGFSSPLPFLEKRRDDLIVSLSAEERWQYCHVTHHSYNEQTTTITFFIVRLLEVTSINSSWQQLIGRHRAGVSSKTGSRYLRNDYAPLGSKLFPLSTTNYRAFGFSGSVVLRATLLREHFTDVAETGIRRHNAINAEKPEG